MFKSIYFFSSTKNICIDNTDDDFLYESICSKFTPSFGREEYIKSSIYHIIESESTFDNYSFNKGFCINFKQIRLILKEFQEELYLLLSTISPIIYDEEDPETWKENLLELKYAEFNVSISYDNKEGRKIWQLYNTIKILNEESKKDGSLILVIIEIPS